MSTQPNVSYQIKRDEPIEKALRKFKRLVDRAGIIKLVRAKRYYEKPSEARRREMRRNIRNRRRAERKAAERMRRKMDKARRHQRARSQYSAMLGGGDDYGGDSGE